MMRGIISENSNFTEQDTRLKEECQNNGELERDQNIASREEAMSSINKTEQESHCDNLLSKEFIEDCYAVPNKLKGKNVTSTPHYENVKDKKSSHREAAAIINKTEHTSKMLNHECMEDGYAIPDQTNPSEVIWTPHYYNIKFPQQKLTVSTLEYTEIPTVRKSTLVKNTPEKDNTFTNCELEDLSGPQNLSCGKFIDGEYSEIIEGNLEVSGQVMPVLSKEKNCKPDKSRKEYPNVDWTQVALGHSALLRRGKFSSNEDFTNQCDIDVGEEDVQNSCKYN